MNKRVELLAPAGDLERAITAINFNANAIYLGGKKYSLRARANNFDIDELAKAIKYAHSHKAKVYLVTNILCHNGMTKDFKPYLDELMDYDVLIAPELYNYRPQNSDNWESINNNHQVWQKKTLWLTTTT